MFWYINVRADGFCFRLIIMLKLLNLATTKRVMLQQRTCSQLSRQAHDADDTLCGVHAFVLHLNVNLYMNMHILFIIN